MCLISIPSRGTTLGITFEARIRKDTAQQETGVPRLRHLRHNSGAKKSILIGESFSTSMQPLRLERQFTSSQYPTNRRFFTWTTLWIRFVGFDNAHPRTNFIFLKGRVGSGTRTDALSQIATKSRPAVYPQTCSHRADLSRVLSAADGRIFDDTSILPG